MKNGDRLLKNILWIFPALLWSPAIAFGQAQSDSPPASQPSQQSSSQTQSQPPQKEESAAEAAKKAEKDKAKPKKMYTEEDLAGLRGNGECDVRNDKTSATSAA